MHGKLTIVPTPLGNMGDITLRAIEALKDADFVCAEDTRVTGKLLVALGIEGKRLERLDENVMGERAPEIIARVQRGETIAYCSDAGMPGVSDPGLRLVAAARSARPPIQVDVLPGPTAAATAYVASGTTASAFYFGGFLPRKGKARAEALSQLRKLDAALVFYESPNRIVDSLDAIASAFPMREVAVCRELTKLHEEVVRALAKDAAAEFASRPSVKGEIAIVIDPPSPSESAVNPDTAKARALELASQGERPKSIAKHLALEFGIPRNAAYELALEVGRNTSEEYCPGKGGA